jgi:hypothetical protein
MVQLFKKKSSWRRIAFLYPVGLLLLIYALTLAPKDGILMWVAMAFSALCFILYSVKRIKYIRNEY